jgi:hypothetical protein
MAFTQTIVLKDGSKRHEVSWRDPSRGQRSRRFARFENARRDERTVEV